MPPRCACHLVAKCPWENPLPDVPVCFEGSADLQERTLLNMAQGRHRAGRGRSSNVTSAEQAISSQNSILSREQHTKSMALIISFSSIFAKISFDIELARLLKHDIDVGDAKPIFQRQYWIPHAYKPIITEQMNRLQEADIISTRQWLSCARRRTTDQYKLGVVKTKGNKLANPTSSQCDATYRGHLWPVRQRTVHVHIGIGYEGRIQCDRAHWMFERHCVVPDTECRKVLIWKIVVWISGFSIPAARRNSFRHGSQRR